MNVVADMEKIPYETSDKQAAIINLVFNSSTYIYIIVCMILVF